MNAEGHQVEAQFLAGEEAFEALDELDEDLVGIANDERPRGVDDRLSYHAVEPCGSRTAKA